MTQHKKGRRAALDEDQVDEIRRELVKGTHGSDLALSYGVSQSVISRIKTGTYKPAPVVKIVTTSEANGAALGFEMLEQTRDDTVAKMQAVALDVKNQREERLVKMEMNLGQSAEFTHELEERVDTLERENEKLHAIVLRLIASHGGVPVDDILYLAGVDE